MKSFVLSFLFLGVAITQNFAQNQPPIAVNDTVYVFPGETFQVKLLKNDYDPDGDSIIFFSPQSLSRINDSTWERKASYYEDYYSTIESIVYTIKDTPGNIASARLVMVNKAPMTYDFIDVNNIKALISPYGYHFFDNEEGKFEVPKNSGKNALFYSNLWLAGLDQAEQVYKTMHMGTYREIIDFEPGPISTSIDSNYLKRWRRTYKIDKTQIQYHINNWSTPNYTPIEVIANWPAHGNTSQGQTANLAPFYDVDHDNIYNPSVGDYPLIRGDQALYFVFNDMHLLNQTVGTENMGLEISAMAYAYNNPNDSILKNTIFFHYDITNRSTDPYHDMRLSQYSDFDIGSALDDYLLTDVTNGMIIGYNGDDTDGDGTGISYGEHPPAIGLKIIGGSLLPPDGIDNPYGQCDAGLNGLNFGDNVIDNERLGMTHSNNIFNNVGFNNPNQNNYAAMKNTGVEYGCTGFDTTSGVGPACNYIFPHNSDTLCNWGTQSMMPNGGFNQNGYYWNEQTVGNTPSDRRSIGSICDFSLNAGETLEFDFCYSWARDYEGDNNTSVELLRNRMTQLSPQLNSLIGMPKSYLKVNSSSSKSKLEVIPNPATKYITVASLSQNPAEYTIYNSNGVVLKHGILIEGANQIDVERFKPGMYLIRSEAGYSKFIKL